jgi:hypothetical protein
MSANPIMVVSLSVKPDDEAAFNDFYHHQFLPHMLREVPQILSLRRYEEHGVGGTLRWYNKVFLTIYELAHDTDLNKVDDFFKLPSLKETMEVFGKFKTNSLHNFSRITYNQTWAHERKSWDGPFGNRPFLLWSLEMKPELDADFQHWYENEYLPLQVADIPAWAGARRYLSVNRDPVRHLTFFEAADESVLFNRCLIDIRAPHRNKANLEWQEKVEQAVTWHDATSFRQIYRRPG